VWYNIGEGREMMKGILNKIRCRLGRHDDVPIPLDDKAWKVYCRNCERIIYDYKGFEKERRKETELLQKYVRDVLITGRQPKARSTKRGIEGKI